MVKRLPLAPTINYESIGKCVYCGDSESKLTKEHIMPRGLHGNLVLPEASCNSCSVITSEIERRVLQGFFERGRRAMGITSRHKKRKKPPSSPTIFIDQDNARWVENVPIDDGFHVIYLPILIKTLSLGGVSKDGSQSSVEMNGTKLSP